MLRLRTTTSLSLLALAIGVAGTGWLSARTHDWAGPSAHPTHAVARRPAARPPGHRARAPAMRTMAVAAATIPVDRLSADRDAEIGSPLLPLSMPSAPRPYAELRGHLDGRVVVWLRTDGAGRVAQAAIRQSSGDAVLDAHALATVRDWRFAVPADRPMGLSGELPMRFDSTSLAQAP
jgi:protein TonB